MAKYQYKGDKPCLIYACKGSIDYAKRNNSKGLFYCIDRATGNVEFVDNVIKHEHKVFSDYDSFMAYVNQEYI